MIALAPTPRVVVTPKRYSKPWLSTAEVGRLLGCSARHVRKLPLRFRLAPGGKSGRVRASRSSVRAYAWLLIDRASRIDRAWFDAFTPPHPCGRGVPVEHGASLATDAERARARSSDREA